MPDTETRLMQHWSEELEKIRQEHSLNLVVDPAPFQSLDKENMSGALLDGVGGIGEIVTRRALASYGLRVQRAIKAAIGYEKTGDRRPLPTRLSNGAYVAFDALSSHLWKGHKEDLESGEKCSCHLRGVSLLGRSATLPYVEPKSLVVAFNQGELDAIPRGNGSRMEFKDSTAYNVLSHYVLDLSIYLEDAPQPETLF